jgi:hypothetical protein
MQTDTILYIIIAGILALLVALFQYMYKSKKRSKRYVLLTFLRFLTLFSVLLLLINPKFEKITYFNEKPNLVIAVDNSESIAYLKQNGKAKQLLIDLQSNKDLKDRFILDVYSFGKELKPFDSLSFKERQSNIAQVFDNLNQVYSTSIAPTLVISDGNQTYGNDYEFATNRYKQPIFPVILGDTIQHTDLKIEQLNVNRYAYLKNKFPVEVIAVYNGKSSVSTELKITSGNATIFSQVLNFNSTNASQVINVTLPANSVGVQTYKATLVALENEKNVVNNVKNFAVEVIDQKTNVAIVSDILHPDLGALKKAIESNEQRQATILKPNEFLNISNDFQLVILYQPTNNFKLVYDEIVKLNLNKFTVLGTKTTWSALNNFQTNYQQSITNQSEDFQPTLNTNYTTFIVDDLNFGDFPPLQTEFGETQFSVPYETILYKTINGRQISEPLLATFEINDRREAVLNGEGIWRWRAQSYLDEQSFENFDNFIGKIIQYLSSNQKRNRLNVTYESFYNGNENIVVSAQFFNKNYEFDATANLQVSLKNKDDNSTKTYPFLLKNNSYEVDLSGLPAGDYDFTVSVNSENTSTSGVFKVLDYNIEQQFLNANVSKLNKLSANSQGTSYFIDNTNTLISDLLQDKRFVTIQKSTKNTMPLIDWQWLLAIIALSLAAEWFIRKYNGLI